MAYILLIAGIILIIYGFTGCLRDSNTDYADTVSTEVHDKGAFDSVLQNIEVLRKLDVINEKIDTLSTLVGRSMTQSIAQYEDAPSKNRDMDFAGDTSAAASSLNERIISLKNQGKDIEEIASELGLMKGEVLLRLGMRK